MAQASKGPLGLTKSQAIHSQLGIWRPVEFKLSKKLIKELLIHFGGISNGVAAAFMLVPWPYKAEDPAAQGAHPLKLSCFSSLEDLALRRNYSPGPQGVGPCKMG